jgi:type III restriction enzyme
MNLELKEFQQEAVVRLRDEVSWAKKESCERGRPQAVVLASPTGSGKTVITTCLMEEIIAGTDKIPAEPGAVFLWLSDQPELNEQSRKKIAAITSQFNEQDLVIVDTNFDQSTFEGGRIYFLNTQKLGKDKNLVTKGDMRQYTIWETIQNTENQLGDKFYLIIDEAHRGMNRSTRDENQTKTIVQKFVLGEADVIKPIKLILGVSATPDRFKQLLAETEAAYGRTPRPVNIPPEDVRNSGLLKDKIILFHPEVDQPTDWTLLSAAAKRWVMMRDTWNAYTSEQDIPPLHPAMVIQVEDRGRSVLTRTDLSLAIQTLEAEVGTIKNEELAHAFQEDGEITTSHHQIRKIDASCIQEETAVKFIFFKMALTTGWDCPRAEVMMSFRRAQDHTLIAQLIGRMIRTPFARRIEGQELLNSVSLYLPHFNRQGVDIVVQRLKNDPDSVPPTDVEEGNNQITLNRRNDKDATEAFKKLTGIPTYRIDKIRKQSNTRRLMKLSRLLTSIHAIDMDALDDTKKLILETLKGEMQQRRKEDIDFDKKINGCNEITLNAVTIEQGTWKDLGGQPERVVLNDRNIDDLFHRVGQRLGEGLEMEYWQTNYDPDEPQRPKLELFLTLQNQLTWETLEKVCNNRINVLFEKHKATISDLKSSDREQYNRVRELAKEPEAFGFLPPTEIIVVAGKEGFTLYNKHLYVDTDGNYIVDLNTWEQATIQNEIDRGDVIGWLRNYERKPWALSVPYEDGAAVLSMYPDFMVVRRHDGNLVVDLLEPHRPDIDDNWKKARGLAKYAKQHYMDIGRIELLRKKGNLMQRLNLGDGTIQNKVLNWVSSNDHLDQMFDELN